MARRLTEAPCLEGHLVASLRVDPLTFTGHLHWQFEEIVGTTKRTVLCSGSVSFSGGPFVLDDDLSEKRSDGINTFRASAILRATCPV